jgi:hypothetical protein
MEELGKGERLRKLAVYMRPAIGILETNVVGAYDWNVEVGTRYMFKSF